MRDEKKVFFDLYKANVELMLQTCQLLQPGRQRWLDFGGQTMEDMFTVARCGLNRVAELDNWSSLSTLPSEMLWRIIRSQFDELQLIAQVLVNNQNEYSVNYQKALGAWQKAVSKAMTQKTGDTPFHAALQQFMDSLGTLGVRMESEPFTEKKK